MPTLVEDEVTGTRDSKAYQRIEAKWQEIIDKYEEDGLVGLQFITAEMLDINADTMKRLSMLEHDIFPPKMLEVYVHKPVLHRILWLEWNVAEHRNTEKSIIERIEELEEQLGMSELNGKKLTKCLEAIDNLSNTFASHDYDTYVKLRLIRKEILRLPQSTYPTVDSLVKDVSFTCSKHLWPHPHPTLQFAFAEFKNSMMEIKTI